MFHVVSCCSAQWLSLCFSQVESHCDTLWCVLSWDTVLLPKWMMCRLRIKCWPADQLMSEFTRWAAKQYWECFKMRFIVYFMMSHLADAFIHSDVWMRFLFTNKQRSIQETTWRAMKLWSWSRPEDRAATRPSREGRGADFFFGGGIVNPSGESLFPKELSF